MKRYTLALARAGLFVTVLNLPLSAHAQKIHGGLDAETRQSVDAAMQTALETHLSGRGRQWSSQNSSYSGRITPLRTWRSRSGHFCRAFVEIVRLPSGIERVGNGQACRTEAGIWVRI